MKPDIFERLAALGVLLVEVEYSGSDDDGSIKYIRAFTASNQRVSLPQDLKEEVRNRCYDVLDARHSGWEIDDGASGEFTFYVDKREINLVHNENVMTVETTTDAIPLAEFDEECASEEA